MAKTKKLERRKPETIEFKLSFSSCHMYFEGGPPKTCSVCKAKVKSGEFHHCSRNM